MAIENLPILGSFNVNRFTQFNPEDSANWYLVPSETGKKQAAMYPTFGRKHINFLNINRLIFDLEPRGLFKSVNYVYIVVGSLIYRLDSNFNLLEITGGKVVTINTNVYFTYLITGTITFACFTDGQHIYVYREDTDTFSIVTDSNAPQKPVYIATFGNRIVVSDTDSSQFTLSEINLEGASFNPATCFTISGNAIFAQEVGIIRQFAVLHNTLYIFTDYTTGVWSNIPSVFLSAGGVETTFPWKKNTTYDWNFGIASPHSLAVDFGRITWLAKSRNGLLQIMATEGDQPIKISSKSIDVLLQKIVDTKITPPILENNSIGFLHQYESTIFYRLSAGDFEAEENLDVDQIANSLEFNFETQTWHRLIEDNGNRNRIQRHTFFNNIHFVTVQNDTTVYEMSGSFYLNELTNPLQPNPQEPDSYNQFPFRYERTTPIISLPDYSEFITDYVEIDFVWGISVPQNLVVHEPHVELYYSDDGGISFEPADNLQFSNLGVYKWRMRWYQLGASRNRCYKLISVSKFPIVVLGGVMNMRRASGGAN